MTADQEEHQHHQQDPLMLTGAECAYTNLKIFECTVANAAMLLDTMSDADLFEALKTATLLHSRVLKVMSPRYARLLTTAACGSTGLQQQQQQILCPILADSSTAAAATAPAASIQAAASSEDEADDGEVVQDDDDDAVAMETEIIRRGEESAGALTISHHRQLHREFEADVAPGAGNNKRIKVESAADLGGHGDADDEDRGGGGRAAAVGDVITVDPEDGGFIISGFTVMGASSADAASNTASSSTTRRVPAPYSLLNGISQAKLMSALNRANHRGKAS